MRPRIPFDASHLHRVADFECGSKPYQTEVAVWIQAPAEAADGALQAIRDWGTRVWLYEMDAGELIGFTSLGLRDWSIRDPATNKRVKTAIQIIPNFAIHSRFKRKPDGVGPDQQYASRVFNDVLLAAYERMTEEGAPAVVGLLVRGTTCGPLNCTRNSGSSRSRRRPRTTGG